MSKISDLPKLANPTGAETVIVSDPADGEKTKTTALGALVNAAAQPFVDLAKTLTKGSWPTPSVDGDGVWEYDSYGLGDAFLPASAVSAATVGTPALDADTAYTFDEYGLGESLLTGERPLAVGQSLDGEDLWAFDAYGLGEELGGSAAVPAVVASSALLPSDFDAIGAWHARAIGARFRSEQAVIAIIADSQYDFGAGRAAVPLTQRMRAALGNGGPGWVSPDSSALPVNASYADGEVAIGGNGPGWTSGFSASSPNQRLFSNSTAGTTTTLTYSGTAPIATLDLFHGGGGGTISYAYGAAAPTQIVLPATPGKVALPKPPAAAPWTLTTAIVSGTFLFAGYDLRTGKGAVVHNLAIGGTTAQGWAAADQAQWRASLALLGIHVAILSLGGNDEVNGRSVASFTADMTSLVGTLRAIDAGMDIIISVRGQTFRAAGVTLRMADYAAAMRSLAPGWRAAVFDAGKRFGTDPAQYSYTPTGTRFVALQSDNLHFNQLGRDIFVSGPCELLGA